jgi:NAD(P)-dependent dehydrogenase (short-subunit alcohol dehydrogenase family)
VEVIILSDKQIILIAGVTENIGGGAAVTLTKREGRVVLLGRSLERLHAKVDSIHQAISQTQAEYQNTDKVTLSIDFSELDIVKRAVAETMSRFPRIHGLILSAVTLVYNGPNILSSGHELMFVTNVM